jgi:hypothetical protein
MLHAPTLSGQLHTMTHAVTVPEDLLPLCCNLQKMSYLIGGIWGALFVVYHIHPRPYGLGITALLVLLYEMSISQFRQR